MQAGVSHTWAAFRLSRVCGFVWTDCVQLEHGLVSGWILLRCGRAESKSESESELESVRNRQF